MVQGEYPKAFMCTQLDRKSKVLTLMHMHTHTHKHTQIKANFETVEFISTKEHKNYVADVSNLLKRHMF